jgi:hypothetical protein
LSASETIEFKSIVVVPDAVTCEGKVLLTVGTELLVNTAVKGTNSHSTFWY